MSSRIPPNNEDAERGLLGSVLMDYERVLALCIERGVSEESFYVPAHRIIYRNAVELMRTGRPVELLSLGSKLRDSGAHDTVGGQVALEALVDATPTSAHASYYIQIVKDCEKRRNVIGESARLAEDAYKMDSTIDESIAQAANTMSMLVCNGRSKSMADYAKEQQEAWMAAAKGGYSGIPSPWFGFNKQFQGAQPGTMSLMAARGGIGKSSAICTWAHYLGRIGVPCGYMPLEDGVRRALGRLAGIEGDFSTFMRDQGKSSEADIVHSQASFDRILAMPIHMSEGPFTVDQICAWAVMAKSRWAIKMLFVDAFKDILRDDHEVAGDNSISQTLCALAKRLDIHILVSHHVRKTDPSARSTKLTGQDIRGSGRLYDDARQVMIIQHEVIGGEWEFTLDLCKNNYGPTIEGHPMERVSNRNRWAERLVPAYDFQTEKKEI